MNAIRFATAAATFLAIGLAQASEITDFTDAPSTKAREDVRQEAQAANNAGKLRYDFTGPAVEPMSVKAREEVRRDTLAQGQRDDLYATQFVGGM